MNKITVPTVLDPVTQMFNIVEYKVFPILLLLAILLITPKIISIATGLSSARSTTTKKVAVDGWKVVDFWKLTIDSKKKETGYVKFHFFVKHMEKQAPVKGFFVQFNKIEYIKVGKEVYKKDSKRYDFSVSEPIFQKIKQGIQEPIANLHDDIFLIQFHDMIHYALANLMKFCEMQDVVKLEEEVDLVVKLVGKIKKFADGIHYSANEKNEKLRVNSINEILAKHHTAMEQLTTEVEIFNGQNPSSTTKKPTISLEKEC